MNWRHALVERADEVAAFRSALDGAATDGRFLLIEGPAGIGKSRLLDELRQQTDAFVVLAARGGLLEREIPFGVARQLFEWHVAHMSAPDRAELLGGAAGAAAAVLGLAEVENDRSMSDLGRLLHGLFWLVANLAERRPLMLVVDDIQWSDSASLHFLAYLARRLDGLPVLVAVTARDGESWADDGVMAEIVATTTAIRPAPLTVAGVSELMQLLVGAPCPRDLIEACCSATGGNPFYLGELLMSLAAASSDPADIPIGAIQATVPSNVARAVLFRLGRLGDAAKGLAVAAAILGDGATLRQAAMLAGLETPLAESAADTLIAASILTGIRPVRFTHPIVLAAITEEIPPARRSALHRQAALVLKGEGATLDRLVLHMLRGTPTGDPWVVETLQCAAIEAGARGVPDAAARFLRRALEEPAKANQAQILAHLSAAELLAGAYGESAATAARAIEAAPSAAARAPVRLHQAYAVLSVEGALPGLRCLERGINEAAKADPELALVLEGELAFQSWMADVPHPVLERIQRHRDRPGTSYGERFVLSVLAVEALRHDEPAEVARDFALRAWAEGRLLADDPRTMAFYCVTVALLAAEANGEAHQVIAHGLAETRRQGIVYGYGGMCWMRGLLAMAEGDLVAAEAEERACVDNAVPTMVGIGVASLALVLLEQGDADAAHNELERGGLLDDARPLYVWGPYVRGLVRLALGRPADALVDLDNVGRHAVDVGGFPVGLPWRVHAALALDALGDREEARRTAAEELERARRHGGARILGGALRASGLVSCGEERLTCLAGAVAALEPTPARLDLARARFDLGIALLRAGRRREGRSHLERSYDGARACGARGLARAAYDELLVAGARPRRLTFSGIESLTASERRVASMASEGLSNRDIAQALFVTPKTVENQLGRVYVKLDISSRRELQMALADRPSGGEKLGT